MFEGSDEVDDFYASRSTLQRGSMPGSAEESVRATASPQRGIMPGGIVGDPSDTHDPFLGVVNRHERFVDDITGQPLDPELCRVARKAGLDYFRSKGVWSLRPIKEAWRLTNRLPISVRWVEVNKGDDDNPKYRSRLVAREIRMAGEDAIFAPTPPLESLPAPTSAPAAPHSASAHTQRARGRRGLRVGLLPAAVREASTTARTGGAEAEQWRSTRRARALRPPPRSVAAHGPRRPSGRGFAVWPLFFVHLISATASCVQDACVCGGEVAFPGGCVSDREPSATDLCRRSRRDGDSRERQ